MNILFIGLGRMGKPMAQHLIQAGHEVIAYHRRPQKLKAWLADYPQTTVLWDGDDDANIDLQQQQLVSWPQALAAVDTIITCVGADQDLDELAYGQAAISATAKAGTIWIDHTTTSSKLAQSLAHSLAQHQIDYVDAPVSGGEDGAIQGTLTLLAGAANQESYQRAMAIVKPYVKQSSYIGEQGKGQLAKMVNQIAIAGVLQGLAEAVYFAEQHQLPIDKLAKAMGGGAAQSWQLDNRMVSMHQRRFNFGFAIDWMRKDLRICLAQAQLQGLDLPATTTTLANYDSIVHQSKHGEGQWDTSALVTLYEQLNSTTA